MERGTMADLCLLLRSNQRIYVLTKCALSRRVHEGFEATQVLSAVS